MRETERKRQRQQQNSQTYRHVSRVSFLRSDCLFSFSFSRTSSLLFLLHLSFICRTRACITFRRDDLFLLFFFPLRFIFAIRWTRRVPNEQLPGEISQIHLFYSRETSISNLKKMYYIRYLWNKNFEVSFSHTCIQPNLRFFRWWKKKYSSSDYKYVFGVRILGSLSI